MSPQQAALRRFVLLVAAAFGLIVILGLALGLAFLDSRAHDSRRGCERNKADRTINANGWRTAGRARTKTALNPDADLSERGEAVLAAYEYTSYAISLESRTGDRLDCRAAFPRPHPLSLLD